MPEYSVTTTRRMLFERGDYIRHGESPRYRVVDVTGDTLTCRPAWFWPAEWFRAAWETFVLWPLRDRRERREAIERLLERRAPEGETR